MSHYISEEKFNELYADNLLTYIVPKNIRGGKKELLKTVGLLLRLHFIGDVNFDSFEESFNELFQKYPHKNFMLYHPTLPKQLTQGDRETYIDVLKDAEKNNNNFSFLLNEKLKK